MSGVTHSAGPGPQVRPSPSPAIPQARDRAWDLLLVCIALHLLTAVGRIHELFPILTLVKLPLVSGAAAICLYALHHTGARRLGLLFAPTTKYLLVLLLWIALSIPGALYPGAVFDLLTDRFIKTVILYLLIVGAVRNTKDVERLAFMYFAGAALYALVVLLRFDVGGASWRLGTIYYYDANDFATLVVTALPLGLYFTLARRALLNRLLAAAGVGALIVGFIWSGSRGSFIALVPVALFILFRYLDDPDSLARARCRGRRGGVPRNRERPILDSDEHDLRLRGGLQRNEERGRVAIWKRGHQVHGQHPFLGARVGADNFPVAEGAILLSQPVKNAGIGSVKRRAQHVRTGWGRARRARSLVVCLDARHGVASPQGDRPAIAPCTQTEREPSPTSAGCVAAGLCRRCVLSLAAYHEGCSTPCSPSRSRCAKSRDRRTGRYWPLMWMSSNQK